MREKQYSVEEAGRLLDAPSFLLKRWCSRGYLRTRESEHGPVLIGYRDLLEFIQESPSRLDSLRSAEERSVLVVDDQEPLLRALRRMIQRVAPDRRVLEARSGHNAIVLSLAHRCELVLLDVHIPGISGPDVCREIRRRGGEPRPRIVMMTASLGTALKQECLQAGADDCIEKPGSLDALRPFFV